VIGLRFARMVSVSPRATRCWRGTLTETPCAGRGAG
jgi:hypothetical protein